MASRFTKAFQLTALAVTFAVANVYVMAAPARLGTDPRSTDPSGNQPKAEKVMTEAATPETALSDGQSQTAEAASERMPLTAGTKKVLTRIFSRQGIETRAAAGSTFLKASTSSASMFKAPAKYNAVPQDDDTESGGGGSKGAWIAVGVIAAVLTVAIIGLRMDRGRTDIGHTDAAH